MDVPGSLRISPAAGGDPTIVLDGDRAVVTLGGGRAGTLVVQDAAGRKRLEFEIVAGGARIRFQDEQGRSMCELVAALGAAVLSLGGNGFDGSVLARNAAGEITVRVDGRDGDIELGGADAAEEWPLGDGLEDAPPGSVMTIDPTGRLQLCATEYDRRVAGVVSGAGAFRPGIVLGRTEGSSRTVPVALAGRVACLVDASRSPIRAGDLLTTSPVPGHAMRADDPTRAFGSVLGKALGPLKTGRGSVPALVALH